LVVRRFAGIGREGDLTTVGGDVETVTRRVPAHPTCRVGCQVDHILRSKVKAEEVRHLAVGQPTVPVPEHSIFGDVGLDRIFFEGGRPFAGSFDVRCVLEDVSDEDQAGPVR